MSANVSGPLESHQVAQCPAMPAAKGCKAKCPRRTKKAMVWKCAALVPALIIPLGASGTRQMKESGIDLAMIRVSCWR